MAEDLFAILSTSAGDIRVHLFPNHAPKTVANFVASTADPAVGSSMRGRGVGDARGAHGARAGAVAEEVFGGCVYCTRNARDDTGGCHAEYRAPHPHRAPRITRSRPHRTPSRGAPYR